MNRRELIGTVGAAPLVLATPESDAEAAEAPKRGPEFSDEWVTFWNTTDRDADLRFYWNEPQARPYIVCVPRGGYVCVRKATAERIIAAEWLAPR